MSTDLLNATAVKEIERLALASQGLVEIGGRTFSRVPLSEPLDTPDRLPATLTFHTLTSLSQYVRQNLDGLDFRIVRSDKTEPEPAHKSGFLHVEDPTTVSYLSGLVGRRCQRAEYAKAVAITPSLSFGMQMDTESFIIMLQAHFEESAGRTQALSLVSGLKCEAVQEYSDDGVSQKAIARAGIVAATEVKVPNPVQLRPRRTFLEIAQPESPFILRLHGGGNGARPKVSLHEADGGAWKLTAVMAIAAWLRSELGTEWTVYA